MKLTSVICSALLARAVTSCWAGAKGTVYKMTLHKVIDRQGTGKVAGTYLIPKGWSAEDNVTWVPNDYVTPVVATSKIKSPDGLIELQTLSGINIGFSHGPAGDSGQMPPRSVTDLLVQSFQRDYPGVQFEIVSKTDEPLNDPVLSNPSLGTARAERGTLKLRFTKNGRAMLLKSTARLDSFATHPEPTAIGGNPVRGLVASFPSLRSHRARVEAL
ncbi:MAG TPA: hypothetical protein VG944_08805 [Fimbriimonas sp.]|nr:hypothetical protein [Fimbriimonas sp.]